MVGSSRKTQSSTEYDDLASSTTKNYKYQSASAIISYADNDDHYESSPQTKNSSKLQVAKSCARRLLPFKNMRQRPLSPETAAAETEDSSSSDEEHNNKNHNEQQQHQLSRVRNNGSSARANSTNTATTVAGNNDNKKKPNFSELYGVVIQLQRNDEASTKEVNLQSSYLQLSNDDMTKGSNRREFYSVMRLMSKFLYLNNTVETLDIGSSLIFNLPQRLKLDLFNSIAKINKLKHFNVYGDMNRSLNINYDYKFSIAWLNKALNRKGSGESNSKSALVSFGLHNLSLRGSDKEFQTFYKVLEHNCAHTLEKITFYHVHFPAVFPTGFDPVIESISEFTNLQEIRIHNLGGDGSNSKATTTTSKNPAHNITHSTFSKFIYSGRNKYLKHLSLSHLHLCKQKVAMISSLLADSFTINLQSLNLSHNQIDDRGCCTIANTLLTNTKLQELNVSYNLLGQYSAIAIGLAVQVNTTLRKLDISHNDIGNEGCIAICQAFYKSPTITTTSENNTSTTTTNIDDDDDSTTKANNNEDEDDEDSGFLHYCSLEELNLNNCGISKEGYISIINAIRCANHGLQCLSIRSNQTILNAQIYQQLVTAMEHNTTIQELILDDPHLLVYDGDKLLSESICKTGSEKYLIKIHEYLNRNSKVRVQ